jgi:hypothetical protein
MLVMGLFLRKKKYQDAPDRLKNFVEGSELTVLVLLYLIGIAYSVYIDKTIIPNIRTASHFRANQLSCD